MSLWYVHVIMCGQANEIARAYNFAGGGGQASASQINIGLKICETHF